MTVNTHEQQALPHWQVSTIYPSLDSEAFRQASAALHAQIDGLDRFLDEARIAPGSGAPAEAPVLSGYLERMNALVDLYGTLRSYIWSFVSTDSYNTQATRLYSELQMAAVRVQQQELRFQGWLGAQAAALPAALAPAGPAHEHAFYLQELAEQSRYLMGGPEEALAAELSLSGAQAWSKLQGTLCSQMLIPFERDGQTERLPLPALQNLYHDPSDLVRRQAYQAELAALEAAREPLAACLNGVKGAVIVLNQRRGRVDALHAALDDARIDRPTLEAMLTAIEAAFPSFRRYLRRKAARLGKPALPWPDLLAPVPAEAGAPERTFTFSEAEGFVVEQFGRFSPRLAGLARRAFDGGWVDAEPRRGKRGGAFCMGIPANDESRVLVNFDGSLDSVFTLAHELGHAFHNECLIGRTALQRNSPMTLNETASIFCETIVTEAVLAQAHDPAAELSILETALIGLTQTIVDITSRYYFEKDVFERRARAELSADELCDLMLRAQAATYGDGLDPQARHPYMWAWKPHYYRTDLSFYNFPYAFGQLFGIGLYALYRERGPAFVSDYEALLAGTGQATAADLAGRFGIDLRRPDFWADSLKVIERHVDRYCQL